MARVAAFVPLEVTVIPTPRYGGGWEVRWGPAVHGAVHQHLAAALLHAEELRASTPEDQAQWVTMHPVVEVEGSFQVASTSTPGTYYTVTPDGTCSCPGYYYRGTCRHLVEAGITPKEHN